jgi:hypothetical protein
MPFPLIPAILAAAGAAGQVGASAIGGAAAAADKEKARALIDGILKEYSGVNVPELERIVGETLGPSAMEGVNADPRLRQEQLGSLEQLSNLSETGNNAETRARLGAIMSQLARQEGAGRNAILNSMRARGVSGSGAELAAQLSNQQATAERAQTAGLQTAADANRRALDALLQKGNMAGQIRSQDFSQDSAKAQARDAIARYNADSRSRAGYYNAQLPAQQFQMTMQKLAGKSNAATGSANAASQAAAATQNAWGNVGNAANSIGSGVAGELAKPKDPYSGYTRSINPSTGEDEGIPYYLRRTGGG